MNEAPLPSLAVDVAERLGLDLTRGQRRGLVTMSGSQLGTLADATGPPTDLIRLFARLGTT